MNNFANEVVLPSPSEREKSIIRKVALALAFSMMLMLFLSAFMQVFLLGMGKFINKDLAFSDFYKQLTALVSYVVSLTVPFSMFGAYTKIPVESALKNRKTSPALLISALLLSLAISVVGVVSSVAVTFFLSRLGIVFSPSFSYVPQTWGAFTLYLLNMTVVPAVLEEMAFRGFVLQSLRRFGDGFALFASSLCFALIHVVPTRFPHTFIMGLVIGYFVIFTGSLRTGIIIHFVYNLVVTSLSLLADAFLIDSALLNTLGQIVMLLLGLPALIYLVKNYHGMFSLRQGRAVNIPSVNIKTFVKSKGMIFFYICVLILSIKDMAVL